MITADVCITVNGENKSFASFLTDDKLVLSRTQLVEVENQLRILLDHVVELLCDVNGRTSDPFPEDPGHHRTKLVRKKKRGVGNPDVLESRLENTAGKIRAKGTLQAWLDSETRRLDWQMQGLIVLAFLEAVEKGTHNLRPILGSYEEKVRSRIDAILWLTSKHVSLAHALLVLYTFSSKDLKGFSPAELLYVFMYLIRHRRTLFCRTLELKARELILRLRPTTQPPYLISGCKFNEYDEEDTLGTSTSPLSPSKVDNTPAVESSVFQNEDYGGCFRDMSTEIVLNAPAFVTQSEFRTSSQSTSPIVHLAQENCISYEGNFPERQIVNYSETQDSIISNTSFDMQYYRAQCIRSHSHPFSLKRKSTSPHGEPRDGNGYDGSHEASGCSVTEPGTMSLALLEPSSDSYKVLVLIAVLGGDMIPLDLIRRRLQMEQKRWTLDGEVGVLTPPKAGLDTFFQNFAAMPMSDLMEELPSYITRRTQNSSSEGCYTIASHVKQAMRRHVRVDHDEIILQILRLVCLVFPREKLWEQYGSENIFVSDTKALLPCLGYLLTLSKEVKLPWDLKEELLQCVLVKAGLEATPCEQDLVYAERLLSEDAEIPRYLAAALSYRQSVLARLNGDYVASNSYIDKSPLRPTADAHVDRRLSAWRFRLIVSRLKNLTMLEKFREAHDMLRKWTIPRTPSLMERQVHISYSLVAADIQRSLGQLESSKEYLRDCYLRPQLLRHDSRRYQFICALIDVHCALGEIDEAEALIFDETKNLPNGLSKGRRRLMVSSLDVDIARESETSFMEARSKISKLDDFYSKMQCLDISDQLLHVRTLIASARVYHLQSSFTQAIDEWERVKALAGDYSAFRKKGFTFAFCQLSIGYAQIKLALESIEQARAIFIEEKDNYWVPVITTEWLPMIRKELATLLQ